MAILRHKLTIQIGRITRRYEIVFDSRMRWPHLNKDLIDALSGLAGVILIHPRGNLSGFKITAETPASPRKDDLYNRIYGAFKRFGYELEECG